MANPKSDQNAIDKFMEDLLNDGYTNIKKQKAPADILAKKDGVQYYFEIKKTMQKKSYFGAATLTEWESAIQNPNTYKFVIAKTTDDINFKFKKYTPAEFMAFSTIPPFKINFNIDLKVSTKVPTRRSAKQLTEKNLELLSVVYKNI